MTNYKWWFTKNGEEKMSVKQRLQEKGNIESALLV